jgi:hypothetical protein
MDRIGSFISGLTHVPGAKTEAADMLSQLMEPQQTECQAPPPAVNPGQDVAMMAHQELGGLGNNVFTFA